MTSRKVIYFFIIIIGFNIVASQHVASAPEQLLEVHFIDVGQGDSIYIKTPKNKHILIDGGPPKAGDIVVDYLLEQHVNDIDLIIATHPHYDHIGGLITVIEKIPVKQIIHTDIVHPTKTFISYIYHVWKKMIPINIPTKNERIYNEDNLFLEVINSHTKNQSINNASLALKLNYHNVSFLLLSDLEKAAERRLQEINRLKADIVKIAHHGSSTSSSFGFLQQIDPHVAILTYGRGNKFGHPNERVVENINFLDALIYSTATFGNIVVTTNGNQFYVSPTSHPLERAFIK